eukprot:scaffold291606_cov17-Tisochrysis_lutea.AAC.1
MSHWKGYLQEGRVKALTDGQKFIEHPAGRYSFATLSFPFLSLSYTLGNSQSALWKDPTVSAATG